MLGTGSIRSDEYMKIDAPAQLVYVLLDSENKMFWGELFIKALFVPSYLTCQTMHIDSASRSFNETYDNWILSLWSFKD